MAAVTEGDGEVPDALACPPCGANNVDLLRMEDPADGDQEPDRMVVTCEVCSLRYRLP
jgi:hypothetical protein